MKKDPLPAEFVTWLRAYIRSRHFTSVRRLHRGLILRWTLWQDGNPENALPGYKTCPPAGPNDQPLGWSYQKFHAIARETIGTPTIHAARKAASATSRHDCGSGWDFAICPVCKRGHGYVIQSTNPNNP